MKAHFPSDRQSALYVLGGIVAVIGVFGLIAAWNTGFTEATGVEVIDVPADYMWGRQFAFNPLGALCMAGVGMLTLVVAGTRLRGLAVATAAASGMVALLTLVQLGADGELLGSRAGNVSLLVATAAALLAIALSPAEPDEGATAPSGSGGPNEVA